LDKYILNLLLHNIHPLPCPNVPLLPGKLPQFTIKEPPFPPLIDVPPKLVSPKPLLKNDENSPLSPPPPVIMIRFERFEFSYRISVPPPPPPQHLEFRALPLPPPFETPNGFVEFDISPWLTIKR
jgi:hypothetical protein